MTDLVPPLRAATDDPGHSRPVRQRRTLSSHAVRTYLAEPRLLVRPFRTSPCHTTFQTPPSGHTAPVRPRHTGPIRPTFQPNPRRAVRTTPVRPSPSATYHSQP